MSKLLNTAMLLAFAGLLGPHPAPAISGQYQPGTAYTYEYETIVRLNEDPAVAKKPGRELGYKLTSQVKVTNIWQNNAAEKLLKIELIKPSLLVHSVHTADHHLQSHRSSLDKKLPLPPSYLHWKDGQVADIYVLSTMEIELANLLKGVASFFQVQQKKDDTIENDVSGQCKVSYRVLEGKTVKTKTSCIHPDPTQFRHPNRVQTATASEETYITYEFNSDNTVKTATSVTKISFGVNLWRRASIAVFSEGKLTSVSEQQGEKITQAATSDDAIKAVERDQFRLESLVAQIEERKCNGASAKCKTLQNVIKSYKEQLKISNLATVKSANAFLRVMERMRLATKEEIQAVLRDGKNKKIVPQLLDAAAAAQTKPALEAAMSVLKFTDEEELDAPERFLLCLSAASHPSESLLSSILNLAKKSIKNEKLQAAVLTTLGSVARSFRKLYGSDSKTLVDVRTYISTQLEKCKTDSCKRMYLQSLINAAFPETTTLLMTFVKNGGKLGVIATTALKQISHAGELDHAVLDGLRDVFLQLRKPYDSLIRTGAAEILFRERPGNNTVRDFISSLRSQESPEVKAYALAKLRDMADDDFRLREALREVSSDPRLWNYDTLSLAGGSTSFRRTLTNTQTLNGNYGVNVELLPGGLMKRSSFDVNLSSGEDKLQLLSLGLFADGLSGFTESSSSNDAEEEQEPTTAGMELTALNVKVRPYTFFTGTGELMGMVWSGTGSEPTPALQANFMMIDHRQLIPLPNGLVVELRLSGALSTDLSGSVQISLWNRNSHSVVNSRAALFVHGEAHVDTSFVKSHVEFVMGGEAKLDCVTDLEFYEKPYKMCIQLEQPGFEFRYNFRKAESVPGSKHLIRTLKKSSIHIPGKSFDLERKNSEQCVKLLAGS